LQTREETTLGLRNPPITRFALYVHHTVKAFKAIADKKTLHYRPNRWAKDADKGNGGISSVEL